MTPLNIFFIVLVLVLVAIGIYFIFKGDEEPPMGPSPGPTTGPSPSPTIGTTTGTTTPEPDRRVFGRYVKLEHTIAYDADIVGNNEDKHANINFAELEVFDMDGNNIALNQRVSGSPFRGGGQGWKLVDGDFATIAQTLSTDKTEKDFLLVDLDRSHEIKKIIITNRSDYTNRIIGVKVLIVNEDGNTVVKETPVISTSSRTHTLTFPENEWS
jgi:hypothetical protein